MDNQQWISYLTSLTQDNPQGPPSLHFSANADQPNGNLGTIESNRPVFNTNGDSGVRVFSRSGNLYDSSGTREDPCSGVERPLGWMSLDRELDAGLLDDEMSGNLSGKRSIAIKLYLALVTDADRPPRLVFEVELQAEADSVTATNGAFDITVRSIISLIERADLPFELRNLLQDGRSRLGTAQNLPQVAYPTRSLRDFRILAPLIEILTSPASQFYLRSVSDNDSVHFVPMRELEEPRFVLIVFQVTNLGSALQSGPQASSLNDLQYADHLSDPAHASNSNSSIPRSSPVLTSTRSEIPIESRTNEILETSPTHVSSDSPTVNPSNANAHMQVTSREWLQSNDAQTDDTNDAQVNDAQTNDAQTNEVLSQTTASQNIAFSGSQIRIPVYAMNVAHACRLLQIREPQGQSIDQPNNTRTFAEIIQDWFLAWNLLSGLGYNPKKGKLYEQTYTWSDGRVQTFDQILRGIRWTSDDFKTKTSLYRWAIHTTSTKVWNTSLPIPQGQEDRIAAAKMTWDRLVYFFQSTWFLHFDDPSRWPLGSPEFDLSYLHQNEVRRHRPLINRKVITCPTSS
ncbi:hypothetical protein EV360DRAFT_75427 [Lentinula raphanica]|nr:hypothetical protein EV360DRAFT_75427 [Lentinula raphanica]